MPEVNDDKPVEQLTRGRDVNSSPSTPIHPVFAPKWLGMQNTVELDSPRAKTAMENWFERREVLTSELKPKPTDFDRRVLKIGLGILHGNS